MNQYNDRIATFFRPEQIPTIEATSFSQSPLKPKLFLEHLKKLNLHNLLDIHDSWQPFNKNDFKLVHTNKYVDAFFDGQEPLASSNGFKWNPNFADSVRYTNSSLYHAIEHSILHPDQISFSPTSGFHHARPRQGLGFCTFAGQVIASLKIFNKYNLKGAYIDLDGHFGNSIPNCAEKDKLIDQIILMNINPEHKHQDYINDLKSKLNQLTNLINNNQVNYIVFAHGADSHEYDEAWEQGDSGQCSTNEWKYCSDLVFSTIKNLNKFIPITLSLFGGYRQDDFNSVLNLHTYSITNSLNILSNQNIDFQPEVTKPDFKFDLV